MAKLVDVQAYDYAAVQRVGSSLVQRYPFLRTKIIGHSVCGREILAYTLGNGKSCVLFAAAFHAQEWMTTYISFKLLSRLCEMHTSLPRERRIVIVPMLNPDGVEIALHGALSAGDFSKRIEKILAFSSERWNANARGVDLNHNFDAGWHTLRAIERACGINAPAPRRYGGAYPHSEPEVQAISKLTVHENPCRILAMHSQGEEIYWEYSGIHVPNAKELAQSLASESGYSLIKNSGLASHGGYKDWFIKSFCRPGFTLEFGKGENPLPLENFEAVYQKAENMLLMAAISSI